MHMNAKTGTAAIAGRVVRLLRQAAERLLPPEAVIRIPRGERERLLALLRHPEGGAGPPAGGSVQPFAAQGSRRNHAGGGEYETYARLIERIRKETRDNNRNNVTRTRAYRKFYERCREVHWAFLAHMVSRNGGWRMTDLAGDVLTRLMSRDARRRAFEMLEDANAFIFGDAYPQLLLYEASLRERKPLFALLPAFGVSRFMRPVWERFWTTRDSALLTMALIVNEQHYIEGRIIGRPEWGGNVLGSLPFRLQSLLRLNQLYLPCDGRDKAGRQLLAGLTISDFADLGQRIAAGKALYAMLFAVPASARGAEAFAVRTPHTGSRADYWPERFIAAPASQGEDPPDPGGRLRSPRLSDAWDDKPLREPERYDWLSDAEDACSYLTEAAARPPVWMNAEAEAALRALALAAFPGGERR